MVFILPSGASTGEQGGDIWRKASRVQGIEARMRVRTPQAATTCSGALESLQLCALQDRAVLQHKEEAHLPLSCQPNNLCIAMEFISLMFCLLYTLRLFPFFASFFGGTYEGS